jgi:aspartyl-tRNA(Asn)/glutamyl-tRNA(Gln) amidotransferase subunit B
VEVTTGTVDHDVVDRGRPGRELPAVQRARLRSQHGLSEFEAGVLSRHGRALVAYFEGVALSSGDSKEACNWVLNDLLQSLNEQKLQVSDCALPAARLGELIVEIKSTGLNKQRAREVFTEMLTSGADAKVAIAKLGIAVVSDESQLRDIIRRAIAANAKAVADYKKGKVKAADAIKGAVMRETKGSARMEVVQRLLLDELAQV